MEKKERDGSDRVFKWVAAIRVHNESFHVINFTAQGFSIGLSIKRRVCNNASFQAIVFDLVFVVVFCCSGFCRTDPRQGDGSFYVLGWKKLGRLCR